MGTPNPPTAAYCTYGDYAQWDDDERWELFEGKAIHLEHGQTPYHQPERIKRKYILGAPDLVIEVLSEASAGRDLSDKMFFYENHDVRCYITANPWSKSLTVQYRAASGRKFGPPETFAGKAQMPIRIFDGLVLDLGQVFECI